MSASSRAVAAIGGLCMLVAASGDPGDIGGDASRHTAARIGTAPQWLAATSPRAEPGVPETRRIQGHLFDVERALRGRATDALNAAQRERRNTALTWLREYRERGDFPHNHTHADARVPVFVDEHGTPCAVAYLLQRSGRGNLVREVASADNNVYAWELEADARFSAWLDEMGLTLEEAARIQPAYGPGLCCEIVEDASRTWRYVAPLSVGMVLAGHLANPDGWVRPLVGAVNGGFAVAHTGFAWNALNEREGSSAGAEASAAANAALAFASAITAWSLLRSRRDEPSTSGSGTEGTSAMRSLRPRLLAPSAAWIGGGLGLQVRLIH